MTLIEKAKSFYGLALANPEAACDEHLADDFLLENYLPEIIPFGGRYSGREGFLQYLGELTRAIDMGPLHMEAWTAGENTVVTRGQERSLVKSTGRHYEMRFVHWLDFDGSGRITNMREYNDTAQMAEAFK